MDPVRRILDGQISEHVSSFEGTSQYTQGGTSACGLAALNAVRIILGREKRGVKSVELLQQIASKPMVDEVVAICATWSSQLHLEVDNITALPMFDTTLSLSFSEYNRAEPKNFGALLRRLEDTGETRVSSAVVITRPPEILAVFNIPTEFPKCPNIFVVFDSHPRPEKGAEGASFIFFPTLEATSRYISSLLQVDPNLLSGLGGLQWQAQLLGHYSGHVFLARTTNDFDINSISAIYDANMDILELKSHLADSSEKIRSLTEENASLRERLTRLESISEPQRHFQSTNNFQHSNGSSGSWGTPRNISPPPAAGPSNVYTRSGGQHSASIPAETCVSRAQEKALLSQHKKSIGGEPATRLHQEEQEREQNSWNIAWHVQEELNREDQELRAQMRRLQKKAQILFDCGVCFEKHPEDFVARVEFCRHKLCRGCMKHYVTSKLEDHCYPIVCPICQLDSNTKKPGVITYGLVEQLGLTEPQQSIWTELELSQFSIVLDCPRCRRCTFVDIVDHAEMDILRCPLPDCNHVWCKSCQRPTEAGFRHSCDGSLELSDLMKSRGWKHCPGCKTPAEKLSGCNHLTCIARGCNTHFCYVCGQSIVRSVHRGSIESALNKHYRKCHLFEDIPT